MSKTDWEQIQELLSRYAFTLDARDYPGIADCFTPDAVADYPGFAKPLKGHEAIVGHMRRALEPLATTQHMYSNFIIDVDGDKAHVTCDILAQHVRNGGAEAETYLAGGKYAVDVQRTANGWKMSNVAARSMWGIGDRGLLPRKPTEAAA
jgi:ketosteroid isomerase-like protein